MTSSVGPLDQQKWPVLWAPLHVSSAIQGNTFFFRRPPWVLATCQQWAKDSNSPWKGQTSTVKSTTYPGADACSSLYTYIYIWYIYICVWLCIYIYDIYMNTYIHMIIYLYDYICMTIYYICACHVLFCVLLVCFKHFRGDSDHSPIDPASGSRSCLIFNHQIPSNPTNYFYSG
jgi:hypothetical protein